VNIWFHHYSFKISGSRYYIESLEMIKAHFQSSNTFLSRFLLCHKITVLG